MKLVSSRENPLYKSLRKLAESGRARREAGLCLLDGPHLLRAACDAGLGFDAVIVAERARSMPEVAAILARVPERLCTLMADALFDTLSPVESPSGILATLVPAVPGSAPVPTHDWLVLDGVQDAGNVGTLLRTAVAAGLTELVLGPGCAHAWSPKVLRAAMGAHFVARIHEVDALSPLLQTYPGAVAVTRLDAAHSVYECDLRRPHAWVFGAEGQGVSPAVAACATQGIIIPMAPGIESLNVAAAAAVCLFEQRRQRAS